MRGLCIYLHIIPLQSQLPLKEVEFGLQSSKTRRQLFRENTSRLILTRDEPYSQTINLGDFITYEVKIYLYVFGSSMKHGIGHKISSPNVIISKMFYTSTSQLDVVDIYCL